MRFVELFRITGIPLCLVTMACSESDSTSTAGSGGAGEELVPLPEGSRELDGIVNLVDATAAAELEAFIFATNTSPYYAGGLTASLNLFLEHFVEEYDFVYFMTDHPLETGTIGRFENVTQPAMPGIGRDFDWEREGYETDGTTRGVIGVQYRPARYGPMGHEMLHYWANHLDPAFGFGHGLEEDFVSHWGYVGIHGVLGGFDRATLRCASPVDALPPDCEPDPSGRFRYVTGLFGERDNGVDTPFDPFELYLMGLVPLSEAPADIPLLVDANNITYDVLAETATVEAASVGTIRVADIVERHGTVRELRADERAFRAAFVVVSAAPVADAVLAEIARYAKVHGNRITDPQILSFEALTGGRATLDTRLGARRRKEDPPPAVRVPTGCDVHDQDCDDGNACYFGRNGGICGLSRGGERDAPCEESFDCAGGLDCASNEAGSAACEPYCSLDETAPDACAVTCDWYVLMDEGGAPAAGICRPP